MTHNEDIFLLPGVGETSCDELWGAPTSGELLGDSAEGIKRLVHPVRALWEMLNGDIRWKFSAEQK